MKKLILAGIVILALGGGIFLINKPKTNNQNPPTLLGVASSSGVILYYGDTCPHCKDVEEFIQNNPLISQKVQIDRKEVYQNQDNAKALIAAANVCGLDTNSIGVPFLVDEGKCYMGKDEVINRLKIDAGLSQ